MFQLLLACVCLKRFAREKIKLSVFYQRLFLTKSYQLPEAPPPEEEPPLNELEEDDDE
ncbi:hypothetical protein NBRC116493_10360 [Aurantivibrio infirmus]